MAVCILTAVRLLSTIHLTSARAAGVPAGSLQGGRSAGPTQLGVDGLQAGACMSFEPTARPGSQTDQTIFLDAGHGGLDPGVVGSVGGRQVAEKDATLAVAQDLNALLRGDGYRVVMARTQDSSVTALGPNDSVWGSLTAAAAHRDLLTRVACANAAQAAVLVSIHFDGFSDPTVGGTETFYDAARPFASSSQKLATDLQSALVASLGTYDRGVWTDDQLAAPALTSQGDSYGHLIELGPAAPGWVDAPSTMPGALVEPLFITNPPEASIASDPAGQEKIARALEAGLLKYLGG